MARGLKCSFCGRPEAVVRKLIAGPKVLICDDCVDVCNRILKTAEPFAPRRWFVAVLVVESRLPDSAEKVLVDLQYKLLAAANPEDAYQAALQLGADEAHEYTNAAGEIVRWKFVGLRDLVELGASGPSHGTEVYSDLVRAEPDKLVMPKERLSVFWAEANKHKTARELLDDE